MGTSKKEMRHWRWATWALWLVAAVILFGHARDYGMSWDEITRWQSGDHKLTYYKNLFSEGLTVWGSAQGNDKYPGLYDLPLALYSDWTGGDRLLAGRYWNIFWGILALVGTSLLACRFSGWRGGFFAALFLVLLPRFYGHIPINPKDIPFAATYLFGVLAALWLYAKLPGAKWHHWAAVGLAAGFAMATRVPGMIVLAYLWMLAGTDVLRSWNRAADQKKPWRRLLAPLSGCALSTLIAYFVLVIFFPSAHVNPFKDSVRVVSQLHEFSSEIPLLFRGTVISSGDAPWYYLPWMMLVTTPLVHVLIGALGLLTFAGHLRDASKTKSLLSHEFVARALVVWAFLFPIAYIMVTQPAVHNGIRHALFVLPLAAVIGSWGCEDLFARLSGLRARRIACVLALGYVTYLGALLIRAHPYQYIYYNMLVGGTKSVMGQYETEYWYTSTQEAVSLLEDWLKKRNRAEEPIKIAATGPKQVTEYYLPEGWQWVDSPRHANFFIGNTQFAGHLLGKGPVILEIRRLG
ncbi:MAG: ArnT family glycosyltransferase, partial [Opitutales bacterium]